ncbi:hypothetical protein BDR04DRAFT_1149290 [Suillus decipiens]|nr:hypothetical protein BDR04DRAFT_1149290 [Suillus decipiens]
MPPLFSSRGYVLAVVGAYACLAHWIAVQVRFFLSSHLSSHLFAIITDDINLQALANLSRFVLDVWTRRLGTREFVVTVIVSFVVGHSTQVDLKFFDLRMVDTFDFTQMTQ